MKQFVVICVLAMCATAFADIGLDLQQHNGYNYDPPPNPMELFKNDFECPPPPPPVACPPPPPPPTCPPPPPPPKCPVCPPPPPPTVCPPPPACNCPAPKNEYLPPSNDYLPPNRRFRKL